MNNLSISACQDMFLAYHKLHDTDLLDIDVSAHLGFALPRTLEVVGADLRGQPKTIRTLLTHDPSDGLLVNPAESAARQLVFRAAHYMEQGCLAPLLFSCMLGAAVRAELLPSHVAARFCVSLPGDVSSPAGCFGLSSHTRHFGFVPGGSRLAGGRARLWDLYLPLGGRSPYLRPGAGGRNLGAAIGLGCALSPWSCAAGITVHEA